MDGKVLDLGGISDKGAPRCAFSILRALLVCSGPVWRSLASMVKSPLGEHAILSGVEAGGLDRVL